MTFLAAHEALTWVGSEEVQRGRGSGMCWVSPMQILQPTWLKPPSHTSKQTRSPLHTKTHAERKVARGGERAQPPSRLFPDCFAFDALSDSTDL